METNVGLISLNLEMVAIFFSIVGGGWVFYNKISEISANVGKRAAEIDSLSERANDTEREIKDNASELNDLKSEITTAFHRNSTQLAVIQERQKASEKRMESQCDDLKEIKRAVLGRRKD